MNYLKNFILTLMVASITATMLAANDDKKNPTPNNSKGSMAFMFALSGLAGGVYCGEEVCKKLPIPCPLARTVGGVIGGVAGTAAGIVYYLTPETKKPKNDNNEQPRNS